MRDLARGDDLALDALMARWQIPLRTFLYRHLQNEHDALDLAQLTFVRVHQHRTRFDPRHRFSTWLFQIALNLARDHLRYQRRRPTLPLDQAPEPSTQRTPRSLTLAEERATAVRQAIAALPDHLREIVLLAEYQHLPHAEIATLLHTTPKAVETRLARARQHLRTTLAHWLKS